MVNIKKPNLQKLKGSTVIDTDTRIRIGITDGLLMARKTGVTTKKLLRVTSAIILMAFVKSRSMTLLRT